MDVLFESEKFTFCHIIPYKSFIIWVMMIMSGCNHMLSLPWTAHAVICWVTFRFIRFAYFWWTYVMLSMLLWFTPFLILTLASQLDLLFLLSIQIRRAHSIFTEQDYWSLSLLPLSSEGIHLSIGLTDIKCSFRNTFHSGFVYFATQ